jgi:hypothetical protein
MTPTSKPTHRRTTFPHPRHGKRVIVTIHESSIGFRLEQHRDVYWLNINSLFDQAELKSAAVQSGFDPSPCKNPKAPRKLN